MTENDTPDWLRPALPITDEDRRRLEPIRKSWASLSAKLKAKALPEQDLLKIIYMECLSDKRPIIIVRCLARFHKMRVAREFAELFKLAGTDVKGKRA